MAIFVSILLAFMAMSAMAVAMEGQTGGVFGERMLFGFSADFWILRVMVPLFLLPVIIVAGLESRIVGTLAIAYVIGSVVEDFFWFVVNPYYGLGKWNSTDATWPNWIKIGPFELPLFYLISFAVTLILWFVFFKNANRVNLFFKKYLPWATTKL